MTDKPKSYGSKFNDYRCSRCGEFGHRDGMKCPMHGVGTSLQLPRLETLRFARAVILKELANHRRNLGLPENSTVMTDMVGMNMLAVASFFEGMMMELELDREGNKQ